MSIALNNDEDESHFEYNSLVEFCDFACLFFFVTCYNCNCVVASCHYNLVVISFHRKLVVTYICIFIGIGAFSCEKS